MTNLLYSFLDDRTLRVYLDGFWSEIVNLRAGTPLGSCLSPIVYIIFMNDMTHDLNLSKIMVSQYADDAGLWVSSPEVSTAAKDMQEAITKLEQWCIKWRELYLIPSQITIDTLHYVLGTKRKSRILA